MPHKEEEALWIEEVCTRTAFGLAPFYLTKNILFCFYQASDVTKRLSEPFIAHFHACLSDIARRASQTATQQKQQHQQQQQARRRPRSALAPVASTPRRVVTQRNNSSSIELDKGTSSGSGGGTRRGVSVSPAGTSANAPNTGESALEDGYSSHGSRKESKDFSFHSDSEAEDGEDGAQQGLIGSDVGLDSSSNDVWRDHPGEESDHDEENNSNNNSNSAPEIPSALGRATSRKEWLEQFCATPLRDAAPASASSAGGLSLQTPSGKSVAPVVVSPQLKAWAAVGRVNGGSGQLLGQVLRRSS